jgi:hypothetical protein
MQQLLHENMSTSNEKWKDEVAHLLETSDRRGATKFWQIMLQNGVELEIGLKNDDELE